MRLLVVFSLWVLLVSPLLQPVHAQTDTPETEITALVEEMERAILAKDAETYATYADFSDPLFATEHGHWIDDWATQEFMTDLQLSVEDIELIEDDLAIATYTVSLELLEERWDPYLADYSQEVSATYPVQFTYDEEGETWRFAGEYWLVEKVENFTIYYAPDAEEIAEEVIAVLPEIFDSATTTFDYIPTDPVPLKVYSSSQALASTVMLSMPQFPGWSEPGEAVKVTEPGYMTMQNLLVHEFTHYLEWDQNEQERGAVPWWLSEGIAMYAELPIVDESESNLEAAYDLATDNNLRDWSTLEDFNITPLDEWAYVYIQGFAFVYFLNEVYGHPTYLEWVKSLITNTPLEEATQTQFDKSFMELDEEFRQWLVEWSPEPTEG
jgi:hypothetical protein